MDETTAPGSPHELLLRLAGRVDDDLLADARELVAVGEDGHALELVTAALAADGTGLPASVRGELVTAARAARVDLDADSALAPAASDTVAHRFTPSSATEVPVVAAVRELPTRLVDGVRLRLAWRQTPAGSASGPLPHPVLLVETPEGGRPGEVLAYQMGAALARSSVHVAVEVLTSGRPLTTYHAAALRDSTPLDGGAPTRTAAPPEVVESVVAEVVEEVTASHRGGLFGAPRVDEGPVDLFAVDDEPAPRPVPMRTWQGGRRRRGFGEPADEPEQPDDQAVTPIDRAPLPSPVPLARRTRQAPAFRADEGQATSDPLAGPLREPLLDPLLDPLPSPSDERGWADEWATGDWTVAEAADDTATGPSAVVKAAPVPDSAEATPPSGLPVRRVPAAGPSDRPGQLSAPAHALDPARAVDPHHANGSADQDGNTGPIHPAPADPGPAGRAAHALDPRHPANRAEDVDATRPRGPRQPGSPVANVGPPVASDRGHVGGQAVDRAPQPASSSATWGGPAGPPPNGDAAADASGLLKPEALARLSDADRDLLARLQAEMGADAGQSPAVLHAPGPNGAGAPGGSEGNVWREPGTGHPGGPHAANGAGRPYGPVDSTGGHQGVAGPGPGPAPGSNGTDPGNGHPAGPGYPTGPPDIAG